MLGALANPSRRNGAALVDAATDCDFHPSGSIDRDRGTLDRAGICRVVVDAAAWSRIAGVSLGREVRVVIDGETLAGETDLQPLHRDGVRGVRVPIRDAGDIERLTALAERIAALDWHLEIDAHLQSNRSLLAGAEWTLMRLPVALCFLHCGGYDPRLPLDHPDVAAMLDIVDTGRGWVKLSDATAVSVPPAGDFKPFVAELLKRRRDRVVWGSGIRREPGAASAGVDGFVDDPATRHMIVAHNPARLYGFR